MMSHATSTSSYNQSRQLIAFSVALLSLLSLQHESSVALAAPTPPSKPTANLCYVYFPNGKATSSFWHTQFALQHYHHVPQDSVDFNLRIIQKDRNENPTIAAKAVLEQGDVCDIMLGPRTSSYSTFVAPIVHVPMISESATSTSLSDKVFYPYFSRTTLADDANAKAMTRLMHHMNVSSISIICLDDSFGKSLASQIRSLFQGSIDKDFCWGHTVSIDEMAQTLSVVEQQAASSVLVLAMSPKEDFLDKFAVALERAGLSGTFTYFLSDAICTDLEGRTAFDGSFCTLQGLDEEKEKSYKLAWEAYDKSNFDYLTDPNGQYRLYNYSNKVVFNAYSALMVDAVQLAMEVMRQAFQNDPHLQERSDKGDVLLEYVRNITVQGISGDVKLDSKTGDRTLGKMELFNIQPTGQRVSIATYISGVDDSRNLKIVQNQKWYIVTEGEIDADDLPSFVRDKGEDEVQQVPLIYVTLGVICFLFIALSLSSFLKIKDRSKEAVKNLVSSSVWIVILTLLANLVDLTSDILGWLVVLTRDGPLPFIILYSILTVIGSILALAELSRLFRFFLVHLEYADRGVPTHVAMQWSVFTANTAVLTLLAEDSPMMVMTIVAVLQESSTVLLVSLSISAIGAGIKLGKVRLVMQGLSLPDSVTNPFLEGSTNEGGLHHNTSSLHHRRVSTLRRKSTRTIPTVGPHSPPFMVRQYQRLLDPDRANELLNMAIDLSSKFSLYLHLDSLEFFCVVREVLDEYEGYVAPPEEEVEVDDSEDGGMSSSSPTMSAGSKPSPSISLAPPKFAEHIAFCNDDGGAATTEEPDGHDILVESLEMSV